MAAGDDSPRTDALLGLKRIDTRCGLANCGGNGVLYRRVLGLFREREADFAQRFLAACSAGDAQGALRAAHDLKATAGTLGMHAVQEAATALELGCMEGAEDTDVEAMVHTVSHQIAEVIDELRMIEPVRAA